MTLCPYLCLSIDTSVNSKDKAVGPMNTVHEERAGEMVKSGGELGHFNDTLLWRLEN